MRGLGREAGSCNYGVWECEGSCPVLYIPSGSELGALFLTVTACVYVQLELPAHEDDVAN